MQHYLHLAEEGEEGMGESETPKQTQFTACSHPEAREKAKKISPRGRLYHEIDLETEQS